MTPPRLRQPGPQFIHHILVFLVEASVKARRILLGEKPGENDHFLDHTCSNSPARRKPRRKQNFVILSLVFTVEPGEKVSGPGENEFGLVFAFLLPGENA